MKKFTLVLSITMITALIAVPGFTQAFLEDDFNEGGTSGAIERGWVFVDDAVEEVGSNFVVAPDWPEGQDGPGTSYEGMISPPTADGTASDGGFLIADSDAGGGSDDIGSEAEIWAITPSFSTVGADQVWFHADAEIESNNNGECVFQLAYSVDGGATWVPVWNCVEPQRPIKGFDNDIDGAAFSGGYPVLGSASQTLTYDGIHGRWHLQLPEGAVNQADVLVRFGYYEPADAWWIALDNILIDSTPPPMGAVVALSEDFENGIPAEWGNTPLLDQVWDIRPIWYEDLDEPFKLDNDLPVHIDLLRQAEIWGYTIDLSVEVDPDLNPNGTTDGQWILMLAGQGYALWQEGNEDTDIDQGAYLDTPAVDMSNATGVFMDFDSEVLVGGGDAFYEVHVSVDGGTTFERIFTYNEALMNTGEAPYFMHHYFEAPSAIGSSEVIFRFFAKGADPGDMDGFWVVDNVQVTKNEGTGISNWSVF